MMGCDIDILIEVKTDEGWKEIELEPSELYPDDRYYELWGFLFSVHGESYQNGLFSRRGLPENCTDDHWKKDYSLNEIGDFYNMGNWHNYTFILYEEIEEIKWPLEFEDNYLKIFLNDIIPRIINYKYQNLRILFRFNS